MGNSEECQLCDLSIHRLVYQDDLCYAMVNLEPLKDYHLMVLPKRHVTRLQDLKAKESQAILKLLGRLGKVMPEIYSEDPVIFMNLGKHSSQPHIHFHILPSKGSLRDLFASYEKIPYRKQGTTQSFKKIADIVKQRLKNMV